MENFNQLLSNLNANLSVIIEDDVKEAATHYETLLNIINSSPAQQEIFFQEADISKDEFDDLYRLITTLDSDTREFYKLALENNNVEKLKEDGKYIDILEKTNLIIDELKNVSDDTLKILGFSIRPKDKQYEELLSAFGDKNVCLYFNEILSAELPNIKQNIQTYQELTESDFVIFLVDKNLRGSEGSIQGIDFISNSLVQWKKEDDLNFISFIITSDPHEHEYSDETDYFKKEVGKNAHSLEEAYKALVISAYAYMFLEYSKLYQSALSETTEQSLKHYNNLESIIKQAHIEGVSPFEAIYEWFQTVNAYFLSKKITTKYSQLFSLAHFFNQPELFQILEERYDTTLPQAIKTFEIFDYEINKRLLPLAPGDIFQKDDKFYILMGQACDLSVRDDASRKAKVAELLEADLIIGKGINRKVIEEFTGNQYYINIQSFNINGTVGTLQINISKLFSCDFNLLDSALFNKEGICQLTLSRPLEQDIKQLLPTGLAKQYPIFQEKFKQMLLIKDALDGEKQSYLETHVTEHLDFSSFIFEYNDTNKTIDFGMQRVCRIRRNFFNMVYKKYSDYRTRTDLNLIDPFSEKIQTHEVILEYEKTNIKQLIGHINIEYLDEKELLIDFDLIKTTLSEYLVDVNIINKTGKKKYTGEINEENYKIKLQKNKLIIVIPLKKDNGDRINTKKPKLSLWIPEKVNGKYEQTNEEIQYDESIPYDKLFNDSILIPTLKKKIKFDKDYIRVIDL